MSSRIAKLTANSIRFDVFSRHEVLS